MPRNPILYTQKKFFDSINKFSETDIKLLEF